MTVNAHEPSRSTLLQFNRPMSPANAALCGESTAIRQLRVQVKRIAPHMRTGSIHAPCMEGALALARAMHEASSGSDGPFLALSPDERTAMTAESWLTTVEFWSAGTLVLVDVDTLTAQEQTLLVRAIGRRSRIPGQRAPFDSRLLATSKRDLQALVATGQFSAELRTQLGLGTLRLPPLIERRSDLPVILAAMCAEHPSGAFTLELAALSLLSSHRWSGDLTELRQVIDLIREICAEPVVSVATVREAVQSSGFATHANAIEQEIPEQLQVVIDRHVLSVLERCAGNKVRAAEMLGISRSTLYRMLDSRAC